MNEFLPWLVLLALTVTVTALLIAGVIRLAVAADRPGRGEPQPWTADRPSRPGSS